MWSKKVAEDIGDEEIVEVYTHISNEVQPIEKCQYKFQNCNQVDRHSYVSESSELSESTQVTCNNRCSQLNDYDMLDNPTAIEAEVAK